MNLEIVAFVLSLICVLFNAKGHVLTWPLAIASSLMYGWVFQEAKLFGDAGLQLVFVLLALYGWANWKKSVTHKGSSSFAHTPSKWLIYMAAAWALLFLTIKLLLIQYTSSDVPNIDALLTAGSLVATYMSAKKWIENWIVWAVVDTLYVGLYIFKNLYLTSILYAVFIVICIFGWYQWAKLIKNE